MNITDHIKQLREQLPTLSDEKLAELAASTFVANSGDKRKEMTVSQVLVGARNERMKSETSRDRAAVRADGTMRLRDTSTYRTYETTWTRLEAKFGNTRVSDLTKSDMMDIANIAQHSAKQKLDARNVRRMEQGFAVLDATGNAGYNRALAALSAFMEYAIDNGHCEKNVTIKVKRLDEKNPKRGKMTAEELDIILDTAISGGDDPVLDHLILWTLLETGARVGGLLHLQLQDINMKEQTIALHEKGSKVRQQPVTLELITALHQLAVSRDALHATDAVFRFGAHSSRPNQPMTTRRIDTLWARLRKEHPWLEERSISSHSIRRSILTMVERRTSPAVTRAYAGHGNVEVTDDYTEAKGNEVARAHQAIFGRKHPLA